MHRLSILVLAAMLLLPALFIRCATPPVLVNYFEVLPRPIIQGENATLRWNTAGATRVTIDNGIGEVPSSGTLQVAPDRSTVYTLTASNGATTLASTADLTVNPRPAAQPPAEPLQVIPALDTDRLLSYTGKQVKVEGDVTYVSSWLPSRFLGQGPQPWTFIFFMKDIWEGASGSREWGYPCVECWRDYTSFFRAIIMPQYIYNFLKPGTNTLVANPGDHVVITGVITGYLSAPSIYLTDIRQLSVTGQ